MASPRQGPSASSSNTSSSRAAPQVTRLLDQGGALYAADDLEGARRAYASALAADPGEARALWSLAVIDLREGRWQAAAGGFRAFAKRAPRHPAARHNLGVAAEALGRWRQAARAYEEALAIDPTAFETRFALARALSVLGAIDAAAGHYRRLAETPAHRTQALTLLGVLAPRQVGDADLPQLRVAAGDGAADPAARTAALFALAPVLEARGDDAGAFEAFDEANRRHRAALGERAAATAQLHARSVEMQKARFTAGLITARDPGASGSTAPIFIVGFPRSGSSLIERMLAAHPQARAMGETGALAPVLARGGDAKDYLAAIRALGWNGAGRFVDKTLENFLHLGAIARMFPRAIVIESAREPMDVGFACWRQLFAHGHETLYDFNEIAAELGRYEEMMAHWRAVLPRPPAQVRLEDLVADPESEIRRLVVEVCALAWDRACLRFHEKPGAVRTESVAQVRQPISAATLGRWRRYEDRLGPLARALAARDRRAATRGPGRKTQGPR